MAQITAALVKELREKTSAGMMDWPRALPLKVSSLLRLTAQQVRLLR